MSEKSTAVLYYEQHRDLWKVGDRSDNPTLNKVNDVHYQLGRGNDLGIDVDLFIAGYDEYSNPVVEEVASEEFVKSEDIAEETIADVVAEAVIEDAIADEVITEEEVEEAKSEEE